MGEIIEVELIPVRKLFYKNTFGIYGAISTHQGLKLNEYDGFTIKGKMQELILDAVYKAKIEGVDDPKYGYGYNVHAIYQEIPQTASEQKDYLSTVMTELQLEEIYKVYPEEDIIEMLKNRTFDYKKVKGFGEITYERVRQKILETLDWQVLLSNLGKYGLKYEVLKKLVEHFGSVEIAIQKVNQSPYCLTEISGIGFKKADVIARNMGIVLDDPNRIRAGIVYVIQEEQNNGHTYIEKCELLSKGNEILQVDQGLIEFEVDRTDGLYIEGTKIALERTYNSEKYVAEKLKKMLDDSDELGIDVDKFLLEQEEEFGIKLTDKQKQFFYNFNNYNVNILVGYAGCVDNETEFFNGQEWKKISDFKSGDMVLQYNENGIAELVYPIKYHKLPETKLTLVKSKSGSINQCLSDEHTVVYKTSKGHLAKLSFEEVAKRHSINNSGFGGKFMTTFEYDGEGINLTDDEIKVMVMVIADGHFPSENNHSKYCCVKLKKERKKNRLEILLNNAKIPFKKREDENGYTNYTFYSPLKIKIFDSMWYKCSKSQLNIIADEVLNWDGSTDEKGRKIFTSNEKESADFIQFVFSTIGYRATINIDNRVGQSYMGEKYIRKSITYRVIISNNKLVSLIARTSDKKTKFEIIKPKDGYKYCFSLPSGMWVMRREGVICITGNCGKSMLQKLLVNLVNKSNLSVGVVEVSETDEGSDIKLINNKSKEENTNLTYRLLAPTGKAAKVLSAYVEDQTASTIHRAIGYGKDKETSATIEITEDIIIIDEVSMLDVALASMTLRKIVNPRARLVLIGDDFQIPSVGAGNFLKNCLDSEALPVTKLDKVFRQSEGGILDIATKIRNGEKFVDNDFIGEMSFGSDTIFRSVQQEWMENGYRHYYKRMMNDFIPDEIMVLSSTKKGNLGTVLINKSLQEVVNPSLTNIKEIKYFDDCTFRVGDYIINTKNTYDRKDIYGNSVEIVNGDMGKIIDIIPKSDEKKEIDDSGIYVQFDFGIVQMGFDEMNQLLHAWCLTMHKSQGSAAKSVLIVMDKAHKFQLNANLIYTAITRCREKLVILCQAETLNFAMKKFENMRRNTFLCDLLIKGENLYE